MCEVSRRYPKRSAFFAHNYTRIITKTCAAQEIGAEAALLCVVIAHLEDAKRYTGPVTFFNEQLYPLLGIRTWDRLKRTREAAIEAGWLYYEEPARGSRKPGVYWATIPDHLDGIGGEFLDEQGWESDQYKAGFKAGQESKLIPQNNGSFPDQPTDHSLIKTGSKPDQPLELSNPIPNPTPIPFSFESATPDQSPDLAAFQANPPRFEAEFIARWNSLEKRSRYGSAALSRDIRESLRERLKESGWDWRAAMAKFPLGMYLSDDAWLPTLKWFLKPDTVRGILDGEYDRAIGGQGKATASRLGAGQRYDPNTQGKPADF